MIKELLRKRFFVTLIFGLSLLLFLVIGYVSYRNARLLQFNAEQLRQSNENLLAYESFISIMKDAQRGQRGYLLTKDSTYLQPYNSALGAVDSLVAVLRKSARPDDTLRQARLNTISKAVRRLLFELNASIQRRNVQGLEAAIAYVRIGDGKEAMNRIQRDVRQLATSERRILAGRRSEAQKSNETAGVIRVAGTVVSIALLLWAFGILREQMRKRREGLELLEKANLELEEKVQERTLAYQQLTEELATSNEELVSSNEELTASNEQLGSTIQTLDQTQQQLQLALESARMGTWYWQVQTGETKWSEGMEAIHGLKKGQFKSLYESSFEGFQRLIHPDDRARFGEAVAGSLREKTVYDLEFRVVWPDESVHWLLGRGVGEYDRQGSPIGMMGTGMDITERKEAERELHESEERYRDMFDNNPQPMWIYDVDTLNFVEVNQAAILHFNYSKEEFFARKADGLGDSREVPQVRQFVNAVKANWVADRKKEWTLKKKDGTLIYAHVISHALPVRNGQKTRIVMIDDITERKRAEEKVRASEAKLRRLYDVGLMGVNYWRSDGSITESNDYFLNMVGYSREDLQRGLVNWRWLTPPGYEEAERLADEQLRRFGYCQPYEKEYLRRDGQRISILLGASSLEGMQEDGIAFVLDITERKAAEERLRKSEKLLQTIFEASADALFLLDADTRRVEDCNQQAIALFELGSKSVVIGQTVPLLNTGPFSEQNHQSIAAEGMKRSYWTTEEEYRTKEGNRFWGNVAISAFQLEKKNYYLIRVRDVTERRTIYEEIKRSQLELMEEKRKTEQHLSIIEADNLRKTRELEEAKDLQVSMLPQHAPQLENLELATHMKTSVEVGGDYYDYKLDEDGTLTIIVGDATGHGLKSGIIVATVKSYFQTLANQCDVVEMLRRISEGIRNLQIRAMYMGVTVIRIKDNQMKIASSGMPPLHLYRHATRAVETITLRGPFLGSTLPTPYHNITENLHPGDALLVLTDGLPELFNRERVMLDYPAIRETFGRHASQSALKVVRALVALGDDWADGHPNEDDYTLLVMKAK
ncbi:MAG: PAS domain S-box protein [Ferruginibacter sp.]|nr:PAS domain S-box protein [Cytophagales bacterium]